MKYETVLKLDKVKKELHKLIRRVITSTKLGYKQKYPDDDLFLEIGKGTINSCLKYAQVRFLLNDKISILDEYELDYDIEILEYLYDIVKCRFLEFRKARDSNKQEYIKNKKKFAMSFFEEPLIKLEEKYNK